MRRAFPFLFVLPRCLCLCLLMAMGPADRARAAEPDELFAQARELYASSRYRDALAVVAEIETQSPERVLFGEQNLHNLKGSCLTALRYFQHARREFERALLAQPGSFDMRYNLAELDFLQEHFDVASAKFAELMATDKGRLYDQFLSFKIALCALMQGKGETVLEEAALYGKDAPISLFLKAALALHRRQPDQAEIQLLLAGKILSPENYSLYEDSLIECGLLAPPKLSAEAGERLQQAQRRPLSLGIDRLEPQPVKPAAPPAPPEEPVVAADEEVHPPLRSN